MDYQCIMSTLLLEFQYTNRNETMKKITRDLGAI